MTMSERIAQLCFLHKADQRFASENCGGRLSITDLPNEVPELLCDEGFEVWKFRFFSFWQCRSVPDIALSKWPDLSSHRPQKLAGCLVYYAGHLEACRPSLSLPG